MRYLAVLVVFTMTIGLMPGCGTSCQQSREERLIEKARGIVLSMAEGDFESATESFDSTMKRGLPPQKAAEAWESLASGYGEFEEITEARLDSSGHNETVLVTCLFEKGSQDIKLVFDQEELVAGMFFVPPQDSREYQAPQYVDEESFSEKEVTVGTGEWTLHGTLTVPNGDGPFPAVVLVHGSGPLDQDESVGPNKPFRDMAWGLASQGILVLRYVKRTMEYQSEMMEQMNEITPKEETVDDALAAVKLLEGEKKAEKDSIYVLGHSLGGMLIPRIASLDPEIHGFIVMAGAARPLEDLILEQTAYVSGLDGTISEEEQAQLDLLSQQVANVKDPSLSESTPPSELPPGFPASYWLYLRGYDPAVAAGSIERPVLVIQGERDYQVTMEDFQRFEDELSSLPNVTLKTYPDLNHLFVTGEGKSTPSEYEQAGHVSQAAIDDIASFVEENR